MKSCKSSNQRKFSDNTLRSLQATSLNMSKQRRSLALKLELQLLGMKRKARRRLKRERSKSTSSTSCLARLTIIQSRRSSISTSMRQTKRKLTWSKCRTIFVKELPSGKSSVLLSRRTKTQSSCPSLKTYLMRTSKRDPCDTTQRVTCSPSALSYLLLGTR